MLALKTAKLARVAWVTSPNCRVMADSKRQLSKMAARSLLPHSPMQAGMRQNLIMPHFTGRYGPGVARFGSNPPSMPSRPNLPDKEQLEKYFFRTVAFVWDMSFWLYCLLRKQFYVYVLQNPTVQEYWKKFIEKMEKARKD